jgi:MFS family permease
MRIAGLVILPFAAAYFLSLFFRSINAIIAPDLIAEFDVSAADLGLVTAAYFLSFGLFQLPLGMLLDQFGPRRVQAALVVVAAGGIALFSAARSIEMLVVARAIIGLGFAGGLMAAFKAMVVWLPKEKLPLANGCFLAIGGLGALAATAPAEAAAAAIGWRLLFVVMALLALAAAAGIFFVVPEQLHASSSMRLRDQLRELRVIYTDRLFWRYAPLTFTCFATGAALQGLWAASWLRDVAGASREGAADHLFLMAIALTVGSAGGGALSDFVRRYGWDVRHVAVTAALVFMLAQLGLVLELVQASWALWTCFALSYNVVTLSYAFLSQHFPAAYAGRVNTGMNMLAIVASFAFQYGIGTIIGQWPQQHDGAYPATAYQAGFAAALLCQFAALLWFFASRPSSGAGAR